MKLDQLTKLPIEGTTNEVDNIKMDFGVIEKVQFYKKISWKLLLQVDLHIYSEVKVQTVHT